MSNWSRVPTDFEGEYLTGLRTVGVVGKDGCACKVGNGNADETCMHACIRGISTQWWEYSSDMLTLR